MSEAMGFLLDSHGLLWWWFAPERLSPTVHTLLVDPATTVLVSAATAWELSLKHHQGKLPELDQAQGLLEVNLRACRRLVPATPSA
jgi:PIN domain nuclease of toxin-antitoxin system